MRPVLIFETYSFGCTLRDVAFTVGRTEEKLRSIRPTSRTWWDPLFFSTLKPGTLSLPRSTPAHGGTRSFLYSLSLEPYHFRDPLGLLSFFSISFLSLSVAGGGGRRAAATPRRSGDDPSCSSSRPGAGRGGAARWCGAERRGWADAARGAARSLGLAGGGRDLPRRSPPAAAQRRGGGAAGWRGGGRAAGRRGGEVRRRSSRVFFVFIFLFYFFIQNFFYVNFFLLNFF